MKMTTAFQMALLSTFLWLNKPDADKNAMAQTIPTNSTNTKWLDAFGPKSDPFNPQDSTKLYDGHTEYKDYHELKTGVVRERFVVTNADGSLNQTETRFSSGSARLSFYETPGGEVPFSISAQSADGAWFPPVGIKTWDKRADNEKTFHMIVDKVTEQFNNPKQGSLDDYIKKTTEELAQKKEVQYAMLQAKTLKGALTRQGANSVGYAVPDGTTAANLITDQLSIAGLSGVRADATLNGIYHLAKESGALQDVSKLPKSDKISFDKAGHIILLFDKKGNPIDGGIVSSVTTSGGKSLVAYWAKNNETNQGQLLHTHKGVIIDPTKLDWSRLPAPPAVDSVMNDFIETMRDLGGKSINSAAALAATGPCNATGPYSPAHSLAHILNTAAERVFFDPRKTQNVEDLVRQAGSAATPSNKTEYTVTLNGLTHTKTNDMMQPGAILAYKGKTPEEDYVVVVTGQKNGQVAATVLGNDLEYKALITDAAALLTTNPMTGEKVKASNLFVLNMRGMIKKAGVPYIPAFSAPTSTAPKQ